MSQKVLIIFAVILLNIFKLSDEYPELYSEPDLSNPLIPLVWREFCGLRYIPAKDNFLRKCLGKDQIPKPLTRVLGGRDVQYRESPWTVQIAKKNYDLFGGFSHTSHHCTGVLITMRHILTAAHCWEENIRIRVYAGSDRSGKGLAIDNFTMYTHPRFLKRINGLTEFDLDYDIAIIKLDEPIGWHLFSVNKRDEVLGINTICLPQPENFSNPNFLFNVYKKATVFGWGRTTGHQYPNVLQRADVSVRYYSGNSYYQERFEIRADGNDQRVCKGDSGSGLVQYLDEYESRAVLIGIMSTIFPKISVKNRPCDFQHVGVGTAVRVVNHLEWINQYLN